MNTTTPETVSAAAPLAGGMGAPARFWKAFWGVFVAEVVAMSAFYGLEWNWLRELNLQLVQAALNALGSPLEAQDRSLSLPGRIFLITPDCTYVDLIICSFPLLWRARRSFIGNCGVLTLFAVAVFGVNLPRIALAVYVTANGGSLFWAHDMIDYLLWYPTLGLILHLWSRSLRELWEVKDSELQTDRNRSLLSSNATVSPMEEGA